MVVQLANKARSQTTSHIDDETSSLVARPRSPGARVIH
jgi:hypothetical protein